MMTTNKGQAKFRGPTSGTNDASQDDDSEQGSNECQGPEHHGVVRIQQTVECQGHGDAGAGEKDHQDGCAGHNLPRTRA